MNDKQSSRLRMYLNVTDVMIRYEKLWNSIPAFGQAFATFKSNTDQINVFNQVRQGSTKGITADKIHLKERMAEKTLVLVSALKAFASATRHVALGKDAAITYTSIMQAKDTDADDICQHVHAKVAAHLAGLADFGITEADLTTLQEAINQFAAAIGQPQAVITQSKSLTTQMNKLFKDSDKLLSEQLDNLMFRFKISHAAFYSEYMSARSIGGQSSRNGKERENSKQEEKNRLPVG